MTETDQAPICPSCKERSKLYSNEWGFYYACKPCDTKIGCHQDSITPLGTLADAELRALRMGAHKHFDKLWKKGHMTRRKAYKKLNDLFKKPDMHIGQMGKEDCKKVIQHFQFYQITL